MRFSLKALFLKRVFEMVLLCSMLGIVLSGIGHAETVSGSVLASDKTITIDSSAHNWNLAPWDSDKVVSYNGYQYTVYWDSDYVLALARRNLSNDSVQVIRFTDAILSLPSDPHNNTAIGISPSDGRLHISYDHHNQNLNYRTSNANFITSPPTTISTNQFGAEQSMVDTDESRVTYPQFFNLNDGTLLFLYRDGSNNGGSGNADHMLNRYNTSNGTWTRIGKLFSRSGTYSDSWCGTQSDRSAYNNDIIVDTNNRIHLSWTYREDWPSHNYNHDIYYAYSDDGGETWKNNSGTTIANLPGNNPIELNDTGIEVVNIPCGSQLINQDAMVVDSNNQPHIFTQRSVSFNSTASDTHYIHYWRTSNGTWQSGWVDNPSVTHAGTLKRGTLAIDNNDDLHFLTIVNGKITYWNSTAVSGWSTWNVNSFFAGESFGGTGNDEGFRYDKQRWKNEGILSVPITASGSNASYKIIDFRLAAGTNGMNATFYQNVNYSGSPVSLTLGNYTTSQLQAAGISDNSISSILVPDGYQVIAYANDNFSGTSWTFTSSALNLMANGNNDVISSIKIQLDPNAYFKVVNRTNGLVLDSGGNVSEGSNVKQWYWGTSNNLQWQFSDLGNGYYNIVNRTNGLLLDSGGSVPAGSYVKQWHLVNSNNLQWQLVYFENGYYRIVNRTNGLVLDSGGSVPAGSYVKQWNWDGSNNLQWQLVRVN